MPASPAPIVGEGCGGKAELPSPTLAPLAADVNTDVPCDEKTPSPRGTFANINYIYIFNGHFKLGQVSCCTCDIVEGPTNSYEIA